MLYKIYDSVVTGTAWLLMKPFVEPGYEGQLLPSSCCIFPEVKSQDLFTSLMIYSGPGTTGQV